MAGADRVSNSSIVFVHGLTGDRERTWTAKGASAPWPQTLLPSRVPGARILTFGYDAYVVNWTGAISKNYIADHASNLLADLAARRGGNGADRRPIIFVCHSLGGLVCQDALVASRLRPEAHLRSISVQTRGILFLGTPHHGSDLARWAEKLAAAVSNIKRTNRRIVEVLKRDSEVLARVQHSFHTMIRSRAQDNLPPIDITCFFEELPLPGVGMVCRTYLLAKVVLTWRQIVPRESAVLPGYVAIGIRNHHRDMTKFDGPEDHSFIALSGELSRWIGAPIAARDEVAAEVTMEADGEVQPALAPSVTTSSADRGKKPETRRGHWVVPFGRNKDFVGREAIVTRLLEKIPPDADPDDCQRTAVDGLGGVGKTQVALEAAFRVRNANPECSVFWVPVIDTATFENAYLDIATALGIERPGAGGADIKQLVKDALSAEAAGEWLLVVDNADDIELLFSGAADAPLSDYLPFSHKGSILFTTRTHEMTVKLDIPQSNVIPMTEMIPAEAVDLLLRNLQPAQGGNSTSTADLAELLAYMPLAIRQASAYMAKTGISTTKYLEICQSGDKKMVNLLSQDFEDRRRYKAIENPVATTWLISFDHIARRNPLAAWYLRVMCMYADKDIPVALLPPRASDELELIEAMGILKAYAFVVEREEGAAYDIHRLVAMAMRNWLEEAGELRQFVTVALEHLKSTWKRSTYETRQTWTRYVPHTQATLAIGDDTTDGASRVRLLRRLALSYYAIGRYKQALRVFEEAYSAIEKAEIMDHRNAVITLSNIARCKMELGDLEGAEKLLRDALRRRESLYGRDSRRTLRAMGGLARVLTRLGRHDEAEKLLRESLSRSAEGSEPVETINNKNSWALTLARRGKHDEALAVALGTLEAAKRRFPDYHSLMARCFHTVGRVWDYGDRPDKSVEMYGQARDTLDATLGNEHPDMQMYENNLAMACQELGRLEDAAAAYERALQCVEKVHGSNHADAHAFRADILACRKALRERRRGAGEQSQPDSS